MGVSPISLAQPPPYTVCRWLFVLRSTVFSPQTIVQKATQPKNTTPQTPTKQCRVGAERTKDATSHRSNKISYRGICLKFSLHYSEITARHVAAGGSFANCIGSAPTLHCLIIFWGVAFLACVYKKGGNPTCGFPRKSKDLLPFRALMNDKVFRPLRRTTKATRLGWAQAFEKA